MYLYNAKINTFAGKVITLGYVSVDDGKITEVSEGTPANITEDDYDCCGNTIFPGFIDAHTHMGLFESGIGVEGDDCNEDSDPVTPNLRTIDAVNTDDRSFEMARKAGITTVVTGSGSANPIGSDIIAIKTCGRYADEAFVRTVGIKFALGENPKSTFSDKDSAPVTRMATAAIIRETLFKAKRYISDKEKALANDEDLPEYEAKYEALEPLLKGEIKAFFHCHKKNDIMTAVRIAEEFRLDYVLVHCTEGYLVADVLAEKKAPVCIGPVISDFGKPELSGFTTENAGILRDAGVKVSICTDHPEVPIQYLALSAAIAGKQGLEHNMESVTVNAAQICGIEDRVGSIEVGKDADLSVFSESPDGVGVLPVAVMIDGKFVAFAKEKEE